METYAVPSAIVFEVLRDDNYEEWRCCVKSYLVAQGLWDIIEPTNTVPSIGNSNAPDQGQEIVNADSKAFANQERAQSDLEAWCKRNAAALHAIQISCSKDILSMIKTIGSAKIAWYFLEYMHPPTGDSAKIAWDVLAYMQLKTRNDAAATTTTPITTTTAIAATTTDTAAPITIVTDTTTTTPITTATTTITTISTVQKKLTHSVKLLNQAFRGDSEKVKSFIGLCPEAKIAKITGSGGTVLHAAIASGNVKFVENLVELMSSDDLEIRDDRGSTALSYVAREGITKMAKCMIEKNKNLLQLPNGEGLIPVVASCRGNHKDLTHYLYSVTPSDVLIQNNGNQGSLLLQYSLISKMFDIALDLLQKFPSLATVVDIVKGCNALIELADKPEIFPSGSRLAFWQRWIYSCIHIQPLTAGKVKDMYSLDGRQCESWIKLQISRLRNLVVNLLKFLGIKQIYDMKLNHMYSVELLGRMCERVSELEFDDYGKSGIFQSLNKAMENGIVEFIMKMIEVCPNMLDFVDDLGRHIFMSSVANREEKIFSLFYGLEGLIGTMITLVDKKGNSMLHWAGKLSPPSQLARISGAALQMQRELQWYEEVENVVNPMAVKHANKYGETPGQLFTKSHQKLKEDGENWMKETATSSTVVGALIITVMFTALFTVPGGNSGTGFPVFLHEKSFITFIIADAMSLFSASTSVLMFLGILTSRYSEKDFLRSLPTKLVIGLSMLFISIATMMVAFCSALIIVTDGRLDVVLPISLLAGIPVTLFILLQFPLLVEIFISTYGSSIFNRKMKRWY